MNVTRSTSPARASDRGCSAEGVRAITAKSLRVVSAGRKPGAHFALPPGLGMSADGQAQSGSGLACSELRHRLWLRPVGDVCPAMPVGHAVERRGKELAVERNRRPICPAADVQNSAGVP
jgi:hypothetical protein